MGFARSLSEYSPSDRDRARLRPANGADDAVSQRSYCEKAPRSWPQPQSVESRRILGQAPRRIVCLLLFACPAFAGAINTDAALAVGKGTVVSRTIIRYDNVDGDLNRDIDRYLARQTFAVGASEKLTLFGSLGYVWNEPGPDGFTDLKLFGRYEFYGRDAKRETLSFAALLGVEIPLGNRPIGGGDGGVVAGLVGTWYRNIWQVDADVEYTHRPDRGDVVRADVAGSVAFHESARLQLVAVLELNFRRVGSNDALYLAPGLQVQFTRYLLEFSMPIRVAEDSVRPTTRIAAVVGIRFIF